MPTTRRTSNHGTKATRSKPDHGPAQSKLAFHGPQGGARVTKAGAGAGSKKDVTKAKSKSDVTAKAVAASEAVQDANELPKEISPPAEDEAAVQGAARELTDVEKEAWSVGSRQIAEYWREKERGRLAPRVHQEGLGLHEKILREWDTNGRFGSCVGISRSKRWHRAHMLGLNPPMEILAVLLRDEGEEKTSEMAYVDRLMISRAVEVP